MRTMILAAVLVAPPSLALAATLGTIAVDPDAYVAARFAGPGTQTWRLSLDKGKFYAVWAWSGEHVTVTVRATGGKALASFVTEDDEGAHGGSFRAPYKGTYTVAASCQVSPDTSCEGLYYSLSAGRDCPGGPTSPCGIAVGQTFQNLQAHFVEDDDWFRTSLQAGQGYTARAADTEADDLPLCVNFRDGRDALLARGTCGAPGAATFTPVTAGTYFVEVKPGYNAAPSTYTLSLGR